MRARLKKQQPTPGRLKLRHEYEQIRASWRDYSNIFESDFPLQQVKNWNLNKPNTLDGYSFILQGMSAAEPGCRSEARCIKPERNERAAA